MKTLINKLDLSFIFKSLAGALVLSFLCGVGFYALWHHYKTQLLFYSETNCNWLIVGILLFLFFFSFFVIKKNPLKNKQWVIRIIFWPIVACLYGISIFAIVLYVFIIDAIIMATSAILTLCFLLFFSVTEHTYVFLGSKIKINQKEYHGQDSFTLNPFLKQRIEEHQKNPWLEFQ